LAPRLSPFRVDHDPSGQPTGSPPYSGSFDGFSVDKRSGARTDSELAGGQSARPGAWRWRRAVIPGHTSQPLRAQSRYPFHTKFRYAHFGKPELGNAGNAATSHRWTVGYGDGVTLSGDSTGPDPHRQKCRSALNGVFHQV
jgi:hypothetical protein